MKLAELYFPPILLFPSSHTCETASRARVEGPVTIEMLVLKSFYLQNKTQTGTIKLDCLYWLETVSKLILALPASSTHAANIKPRVWLQSTTVKQQYLLFKSPHCCHRLHLLHYNISKRAHPGQSLHHGSMIDTCNTKQLLRGWSAAGGGAVLGRVGMETSAWSR